MINARAPDKIEHHVNDALARGATLLVGGRRLQDAVAAGPHYYAPTVLAGASAGMALAGEETFGPVAALFRFQDEQDVIGQANATPFGLAAYFYSRDAGRIWRVAQRLEAGIVGINEGAVSSEAAPFGGVKESGYGREGSRHGLDDYMRTKYMCQGGLALLLICNILHNWRPRLPRARAAARPCARRGRAPPSHMAEAGRIG